MRQSDSSDKPPVYDQNRISVHDCTSFRFSTFEDVPTVSLCEEGYGTRHHVPVYTIPAYAVARSYVHTYRT